jgi:hypothetical protein
MTRKDPLTSNNVVHDEQELIAFHLGETCDEASIRKRLQTDEAYASLSESISHTLRVFSSEPVPAADIDGAWQRLRISLPVLEKPRRATRWRWFVLAPVAALAMAILVVGLFLQSFLHRQPKPDEAGVIHLRPPVGYADKQDVLQHLDRAERWLTTVNHASAPLDEATRAQGEQLLTRNAVYLREARDHGDLPDAFALERLGRVLTTANHSTGNGVQLRVEMNTDGLLFDLRILRQNRSYNTGEPQ